MKRAKGATVDGMRVLEKFLHVRVFPIGAAEIAASIGEARYIFSIAFGSGANIVVEVGMGDDEVGYVLGTNTFLKELI